MTHSHQIRVRYAECDRMGFVHHSIYALYYEEARTEILRNRGISYKDLEDDGILMPVRSMKFTFLKAGKYDDLLTIEVYLTAPPEVRCKFEYKTFNQNGELLNTGETELFFVRKTDLRPIKLPEQYKAFLMN